MTSTSVSRHRARNASRSTAASSCWANTPGWRLSSAGRGPTGSPSARPSARAGSVDTSSTRPWACVASSIATVVFPTPPLPPTITQRGSAPRRSTTKPFAPLAHFAQPVHEPRLGLRILGLVDLAQLEPELQLHQLVLDLRIVRELLFGH